MKAKTNMKIKKVERAKITNKKLFIEIYQIAYILIKILV